MALIELADKKKIVFVGDTHGDLDATKKICKKYLGKTIIVFLGDYVDRSTESRKNIDYLLMLKKRYPKKIYLLLGNHETYNIVQFSPADFWLSLEKNEYKKYTKIFSSFPLAFSSENIIALHGVLPNIEKIEDINKIKAGSKEWMQIVWGDFSEERGSFLGSYHGRPLFGKDYFEKIMAKLDKKILIRSHQPYCKEIMFDKRCLTIFTSSAYGRKRTIAITNGKAETTNDITIEEI